MLIFEFVEIYLLHKKYLKIKSLSKTKQKKKKLVNLLLYCGIIFSEATKMRVQ